MFYYEDSLWEKHKVAVFEQVCRYFKDSNFSGKSTLKSFQSKSSIS